MIPTIMKKKLLLLHLFLFFGIVPTITAQDIGKLKVSTMGLKKKGCEICHTLPPTLPYIFDANNQIILPCEGGGRGGYSEFPVTMSPFGLEFGTPDITDPTQSTGPITYDDNLVTMENDGVNFIIGIYGDDHYPNTRFSDTSSDYTLIKFSDAIMQNWTGSLGNCFGDFTFSNFVPIFTIKTAFPNECVNGMTKLTTYPSNKGNDGAVVAKYGNWQFSLDQGANWINFPPLYNQTDSLEFKIYDFLKASGVDALSYVDQPIQFRIADPNKKAGTDGSFTATPLTIVYKTCDLIAQSIESRQVGCVKDVTEPEIKVEFNRPLNTDEKIVSLTIADAQSPNTIIASASNITVLNVINGTNGTPTKFVYILKGDNLLLKEESFLLNNHTYVITNQCNIQSYAEPLVKNNLIYYAESDNGRVNMEHVPLEAIGTTKLKATKPAKITITGTAQGSTKIGTPANGKIITFAVAGGTAICPDVYYNFTWTRTDKNNKTDIISYPDSETVTDSITNTTSTNLINLSSGTYKVVVKDKYGCSKDTIFTITEPEPIVVTISKTNDVLCFNDASGAIKMDTTTGGLLDTKTNPPGTYSYEWYKQQGDDFVTTNIKEKSYSEFDIGVYKIKATDNHENSGWSNEITIKPAVEITATSTPTHVLCNGGNTGSILLAIAGGSTKDKDGVEKGYTVTWLDGAITQDRTNLVAGTYSYTIIDALGCKYNNGNLTPVTIIQPNPIIIAISSQTPPTSATSTDGTLTLNVSGGTGAYTYFLKKGTNPEVSYTSNPITGLNGTYTLRVQDANGCSKDYPDTIAIVTLTVSKTMQTDVLCKGDPTSTGSITVLASGGTPKSPDPKYTYQWYKGTIKLTGEIYPTITDLSIGTYKVSVTDANRTIDSDPFVITQPTDPLTITSTLTQQQPVSCNGGSDGAIAITVAGGTGGYTYLWNDNYTGKDRTGLSKGTYSVTVTDANQCSKTLNGIIIGEPLPISIPTTIPTTHVTVFGQSTGALTLLAGTPTGGNDGGYTYKWTSTTDINFGIKNTRDISGLYAGFYVLEVWDAKANVVDNAGCIATKTFEVKQNPELKVVITETQFIKCNGDANGELQAVVTGGVESYNYSWFKNTKSISGNTRTQSGMSAGDYTVTVTDSFGATKTATVYPLTDPNILTVALNSQTDVKCNGAFTGAIKITIAGGTKIAIAGGTTTYKSIVWTKAGDASFVANDPLNPTNLGFGDYQVVVTDAHDCTATLSQSVKIIQPDFPLTITPPTVANPQITNLTGYQTQNGKITITVTGGTPAYAHAWYAGFKKDWTNTAVPIPNNATASIGNLTAGDYYVRVTDKNLICVVDQDFNVKQPAELVITSIVQVSNTDIFCNGTKRAVLVATITGGAPIDASLPKKYTYRWYNVLTPSITASTTNPTEPLGAGDYKLEVSDGFDNTYTNLVAIPVAEPTLLKVQFTQTNVSCKGGSDGAINITITGGTKITKGTSEYKIVWSTGTNSDSKTISGLYASKIPYNVTVTDANGCKTSAEITITEPELLYLKMPVIKTPPSALGLQDGSITIEIAGGTPNYTYDWYDDKGTLIFSDKNKPSTTSINNIYAGQYFVEVTDAKGCKIFKQDLDKINPIEVAVNQINAVKCHGDATASIKANVKGGTPIYYYKWYKTTDPSNYISQDETLTGATAGKYYVIASDSFHQTLQSETVEITEPTAIDNFLTADYTLCGDGKDWTIVTNPTEGTPPYTYIWNTSETTPTINVVAGTYYVTVSDKNGCGIKKEITLTIPAHLDAKATITKPTCYAGSDATIVVTTIDGTAPFKYLWDTGEKSNVLSNASAKAYSVDITDARGCVITRKYTIDNPPKDVINIGDDVTLCKGQSLTINATIKDNNAKYAWTADNGFVSDKPIITVDKPGVYSLTVTNNLGCQATDAIKIDSDNIDISAEFAVSSQVFVNEKFIIVDISNPQPDSLEWVLPAGANVTTKNKDFAEMSFSKAGEYELTINTKRGNCTAFQTKKILVLEGNYVDPELDSKTVFDLKIYPNPSDGNFTIDAKLESVMPVKIKLYNLTNNVIIDSKADQGKSEYSFSFNLSGLASGVYYVLFESKQGNKLRKIIIK
jgi:Secretion system C-terminal sorting domain/SprB repeat